MRIIVASCSAIYTGRGDTRLAQATRVIIIKDDGAVSLHSDKSNKPLNYMGAGCSHTESLEDDVLVWNFDTRKENLKITLHDIISDTSHLLPDEDLGLVRDGTESHLQAHLAVNPGLLGSGYTLVGREYPTGAGPVDLLVQGPEGNFIAVEVKRTAMIGAVDQVRRYVEALNSDGEKGKVTGLIAALDVRPNTIKLADKRGIAYVVVPKPQKLD